MFSGIIEGTGTVIACDPGPDGAAIRLRIDAGKLATGIVAGASIAINGACLTAVETVAADASIIDFDVVQETLDRTSIGAVPVGGRVNLERALQVGGRLDGHFVQGHVDGTGEITLCEPRDGQTWMTVRVPADVLRYCIPKGSITIDGVSLTIADLDTAAALVSVALIPTTIQLTTLGDRSPGDHVNLEADMLGKYIVSWLDRMGPAAATR